MKQKTGYLNYFIDLKKCHEFFEYHKGIENMFKDFKPKSLDKKGFISTYKKFLTFKNNNEELLLKYGFNVETINSSTFGTKTFYTSKIADFMWSELFEYYFLFR